MTSAHALLLGPSTGRSAMTELFDDAALVKTALEFEAALARACAAEGLVSEAECSAIVDATASLEIDRETFAAQVHHSGTLAIPLVAQLRQAVDARFPAAVSKVHLGATSQDVADSVCAVLGGRAADLLLAAGARLCDALVELATVHAATPMLGRTLLRGAAPITFGLKVANWLMGIDESLARLANERRTLALQFGGASGTMTGLGGRGQAVAERLAVELNLPCPVMPWHARRVTTTAFGTSISLLAGSSSKIALDLTLMGQDEVAEAFEPHRPGRGGSSSMPHKRNATSCQQTLTAALRVAPLAQTLLGNLAQEHERGIGGWQAEQALIAEMCMHTFDAIVLMTDIMRELDVDTGMMRRNLLAAGVGEDTGEAAALVARAVSAYPGRRK